MIRKLISLVAMAVVVAYGVGAAVATGQTACVVRKSGRVGSAADPRWSADPLRTRTHP